VDSELNDDDPMRPKLVQIAGGPLRWQVFRPQHSLQSTTPGTCNFLLQTFKIMNPRLVVARPIEDEYLCLLDEYVRRV